jgi:transposase-like protein
MNTEIIFPNKHKIEYLARLEAAKPQIKEMIQKRMSGSAIAKAMGMRYSTVYGYIKEIRAAA